MSISFGHSSSTTASLSLESLAFVQRSSERLHQHLSTASPTASVSRGPRRTNEELFHIHSPSHLTLSSITHAWLATASILQPTSPSPFSLSFVKIMERASERARERLRAGTTHKTSSGLDSLAIDTTTSGLAVLIFCCLLVG